MAGVADTIKQLVADLMPAMADWAQTVGDLWRQVLPVFRDFKPLIDGILHLEVRGFFTAIKAGITLLTGFLENLAAAVKGARIALLMAQTPGLSYEDAKKNIGMTDRLERLREEKERKARRDREGGGQSHELTLAGKGFEGIFDTFRRVQQATVTASYDKQIADNTKTIAQNTAPANRPEMPRPVPAVGR